MTNDRGFTAEDAYFRQQEAERRDEQARAREQVLKLLAAGEWADFSKGAPNVDLKNGEEYLDLEHLTQGVQRARTGVTPATQALPRKSVHEDTWRKILRQL